MSKARELLRKIKTCLGGFERARPGPDRVTYRDLGKGQHRFFCGSPRVQGTPSRGFVFKKTGRILIFELFAEEVDGGLQWKSFAIHLSGIGEARIMFHKDPDAARWPEHPETHIQFDAPQEVVRAAPFLAWRLPLGEIDPIRCIEYAVARGIGPD